MLRLGTWLNQLGEFIGRGGIVYSMHEPLLNEAGFSDSAVGAQDLSPLKQMPLNTSFEFIEPYYKRLIESFGSKAILLPRKLFSDDFRGTRLKYKSRNPADFSHLNNEGGSLILDELLSSI